MKEIRNTVSENEFFFSCVFFYFICLEFYDGFVRLMRDEIETLYIFDKNEIYILLCFLLWIVLKIY